jgi:asparagine synthase (glutamine-hydrolysing)
MISQYILNQPNLILKSDLAGEFPVYLYWSENQTTLLYSKSITELLNDARVPKPLKVSTEGLSFLLQSGVVPPPKTAYQNIYILGIGDKVQISTVNEKIKIQFSHEFPFLSKNRLSPEEMRPDEELILQMLAEATIGRIDDSKSSFLFHSAGKDSNSIALALAEAGWQDEITLITYQSKGKTDESKISAKIAKQLGFKHQVLHGIELLKTEHKQAIENYFVNAPFPSTDNVTLAYPLYAYQLPELQGANIIDGGGNDSHMMTPLTTRELKVFPLSKFTQHAHFIRNYTKSESLLSPLVRTPVEWCGMSGLSFADTKKILPDAVSVYSHWRQESRLRSNWDLVDLKTSILTPIVASEMHIRKASNFVDSINSNLILPFANHQIAEYFAKMPENYLFDRLTLKNKLILRKILKKQINLDSDKVGKMGWSYDSSSVVIQNWEWMYQEIKECNLWSQPGLLKVIARLKNRALGTGWAASTSERLLYRIFLLSCWHNHNKFLR